jgi:hypothetical protein
MAFVSISEFSGDTIVLHFGGESARIDAYTFAAALIGFADTARAVSASIDFGEDIEIVVEAFGPGSFRTRVRRIREALGKFEGPAQLIFWGLVTNLIYDVAIRPPEPATQVIVTTDEVTVIHGKDRIVIPRFVYEATENAKKNPDVRRGLQRMFQPLQNDKNVTEFGLTPHMEDTRPVVVIPRDEFQRFVEFPTIIEETGNERIKQETARLIILKAWLNHKLRKWSFEWNGVPVSAPIVDDDFLDRIERREYLIGAGDALDAEITFKQKFDNEFGVYINDPNSFVITKVIRPVPRG